MMFNPGTFLSLSVAGYGLAVHRKPPPVPALTAAFSDDERTDKRLAEERLRRKIKTDMAVPIREWNCGIVLQFPKANRLPIRQTGTIQES